MAGIEWIQDKLPGMDLDWYYGWWNGSMYCYDCGGEVCALDDGYICSGCDRQCT